MIAVTATTIVSILAAWVLGGLLFGIVAGKIIALSNRDDEPSQVADRSDSQMAEPAVRSVANPSDLALDEVLALTVTDRLLTEREDGLIGLAELADTKLDAALLWEQAQRVNVARAEVLGLLRSSEMAS